MSRPIRPVLLRYLSVLLACAGTGVALGMSRDAAAACQSPAGTYFYQGRLDDGRPFGATLTMGLVDATGRAHRVRGRLFVAPRYVDEPVEGEIVDGERLQLHDDGTDRSRLVGGFVDLFHRTATNGATCDGIAVRVDDQVGGLLRMTLWMPPGGTDPFAAHRAAMNAVAPEVVDAIEHDDARRLAAHVEFPLVVVFPGRPNDRVVVRDAEAFARLGSRLIGPNLRRAIARDVPHDLFCRDEGCMLGNGAIWFDDSDRIVALWPG